jgi:hypothetical protein
MAIIKASLASAHAAERARQRKADKELVSRRLLTAANTLEYVAKLPHITSGTARQVLEVAELCRANAK